MSHTDRKGSQRGPGSGLRRALAVGLLAAAIAAVGVSSALAVVTHLANGATVS